MKLNTVTIENFRFINKLTLPLREDVTVLIGRNATGKTAILDAIALGLAPAIESFKDVDGRRLQPGISLNRRDFRLVSSAIQTAVPQRMPASFFDYRPSVDHVEVSIEAINGIAWSNRLTKSELLNRRPENAEASPELDQLRKYLKPATDALEQGADIMLPVLAYYRTKRSNNTPAPTFIPASKRGPEGKAADGSYTHHVTGRSAALSLSLRSHLSLQDAVSWFLVEEDLERRAVIELQDLKFQSPRLSAVRKAIEAVLPGCQNPRTSIRPRSLIVTYDCGDGEAQDLLVSQLSDGYRTIFSLVVDLARRMAQANPHLDNPLRDTEAVVLIDELDLHLHPAWQQRILDDLRSCFQNTQFVISTHSPHILSSVDREQVLVLWREEGKLYAEPPPTSPYGAKSGQVLNELMGISERPPTEINRYVKTLAAYWELVQADRWDSAEALEHRQKLEKVARHDPELMRIDMDIRRRQLQRIRTQK